MPTSVSTFVSTDLVVMSDSTTTTNFEADFTEIQQNTKLKQKFQKNKSSQVLQVYPLSSCLFYFYGLKDI